MKLIICPECKQPVVIIPEKTLTCLCKKTAGKYLSDKITAVVTKNAIVAGIDNNSYRQAIANAYSEQAQGWNQRVDFYFTGWIPNFPGEVIRVKSRRAVSMYPFDTQITSTSTRPTTGAD